jgi:hypothetical protein
MFMLRPGNEHLRSECYHFLNRDGAQTNRAVATPFGNHIVATTRRAYRTGCEGFRGPDFLRSRIDSPLAIVMVTENRETGSPD